MRYRLRVLLPVALAIVSLVAGTALQLILQFDPTIIPEYLRVAMPEEKTIWLLSYGLMFAGLIMIVPAAVLKAFRQAIFGSTKEDRIIGRRFLDASLALSIFGSAGLALLLGITGKAEGDVTLVCNPLFSGFVFVVMAWVWLFSGVFKSTKLVEPSSSRRILAEHLLEANSFLAVFVSGMLCMFRVYGDWNWPWLMMVIGLGGICPLAHGRFLGFQRARNSIDSRPANMDPKIFVKSLELEHNFLRLYFQQVATIALIFITAVVGVYYIKLGTTDATILVNTSLIVTWYIVGIFLGITTPLAKHMEYIRQTIWTMAAHKPKKQ